MKKLISQALGILAVLSAPATASMQSEAENYWSERVVRINSYVNNVTLNIGAIRAIKKGDNEAFSDEEVVIIDPRKHEKPNYVRADSQRVTLEPTAIELENGQFKGEWHPTTGETYHAMHPETGERLSFVPHKSAYVNLHLRDFILSEVCPSGCKFGMLSSHYYFFLTNFKEEQTEAISIWISATAEGYESVEEGFPYFQFALEDITVRAANGALKISIEKNPR